MISFTTNTVTTFTATNTVTAIGTDICQARIVKAGANCSGAVAPLAVSAQSGLSAFGLQAGQTPVVRINAANQEVIISWTAVAGINYVVQSTSDLERENWVTLPGDVTDNGTMAWKRDPIIPGAKRFYRVLVTQDR